MTFSVFFFDMKGRDCVQASAALSLWLQQAGKLTGLRCLQNTHRIDIETTKLYNRVPVKLLGTLKLNLKIQRKL